jgi:hypothetical protein
MHDCDTIGVRTLWARRHVEHAGGVVRVGNRLIGLLGDQHCKGFGVYDAATGRQAARRANRDIVNVGATKWYTVWTPATRAGGYVFLCDRGSRSGRYVGDWANVSVLQARPEGRFVAHNLLDRHIDAAPTFDGDRTYFRTDTGLICLQRIGETGATYEAVQNARWVLADIPPAPPKRCAARAIAPQAGADGKELPFAPGRQRFIREPWAGPFPAAIADKAVADVLARGGALGSAWSGKIAGQEVTASRPAGEFLQGAIATHEATELIDATKIAALTGKVSLASVVLVNDRPRTVRVTLGGGHLTAWLAGEKLVHGERVTLKPGPYPLLVRIAQGPAGTVAPVYVRFEPSDDQDAEIRFWYDSVAANREVLERVVALAPNSVEARRANVLLENR